MPEHRDAASTAAVAIVIIGYNDAQHLPYAVESALAQGPAVAEAIVVDDASTDSTPALLDVLAAKPRVHVVRRTANSGGCGTPRNDGMATATAPWVMFLDSDDVLPPGAVDALLGAALRHDADVVAGLCVRRELPSGRELPWQPDLFAAEQRFDGIAGRPETLWDTLSVGKLYRRAFLTGKDPGTDISFPDGRLHYEDFVFTARVYAARPRLVTLPTTVYFWQVRHNAATPSISLRRDQIANWRDRVRAHQQAVAALRAAGNDSLARAACAKFVAYDVPLYLRELPTRDADHQRAWWTSCRDYLASFGPLDELDAGLAHIAALLPPPARWIADVITARATPDDVGTLGLARLAELAGEPPRLVGPYPSSPDGVPLWDDREPAVPLVGFGAMSREQLPAYVAGTVHIGQRLVVDLRLADPYGTLAAGAPPLTGRLELVHRLDQRLTHTVDLTWRQDNASWYARAELSPSPLAISGALATWDVWARIGFESNASIRAKVRADGGLGRQLCRGRGLGLLLVQAYATSSHSLALRVAGGAAGAREVLDARLRRFRAKAAAPRA
jgi:hypothetical protein